MKKILLLIITSFLLNPTLSAKQGNNKKFEIKIAPILFLSTMIEFEFNYRLDDKINIGCNYGNLVLDSHTGLMGGGVSLSEKIGFHLHFFRVSNQESSSYLGLAPGVILTSAPTLDSKDLTHLIFPGTLGYQWSFNKSRIVVSTEVNLGLSYYLKKSQINFYKNLNVLSLGVAV